MVLPKSSDLAYPALITKGRMNSRGEVFFRVNLIVGISNYLPQPTCELVPLKNSSNTVTSDFVGFVTISCKQSLPKH